MATVTIRQVAATKTAVEDALIASYVELFRSLKVQRKANNGLGQDFAWMIRMAVDVAWDEVFVPKKQNRPLPARPVSVARAKRRTA